MAASNTDLITDTRNAARPNSARVSSGRSPGGTTLACDNLTGWPTASKVHFVTYQIDSNSNPVAGTQLDCYGIRSGNNIGSFVVVDGTDAGNSVNDVVEMLPTAQWGQDLATALTTAHDRLGVHKSGAVYASPVFSGTATGTYTLGGTPTIASPTLSGTTTADIITADSSNHLSLSAGTSKLVKTTLLRQDDTTNTYQVGNSVMLTGWGVITPGASAHASETVTFGVTFAQRPIVTISSGGDAVSATTYGSGGDTIKDKVISKAVAITTTNFAAHVLTTDGTSWSAGNTVFYQWMAFGEI